MVRIRGFHPRDPGSSPGDGMSFSNFLMCMSMHTRLHSPFTPLLEAHTFVQRFFKSSFGGRFTPPATAASSSGLSKCHASSNLRNSTCNCLRDPQHAKEISRVALRSLSMLWAMHISCALFHFSMNIAPGKIFPHAFVWEEAHRCRQRGPALPHNLRMWIASKADTCFCRRAPVRFGALDHVWGTPKKLVEWLRM